jgi:hypothetical protein
LLKRLDVHERQNQQRAQVADQFTRHEHTRGTTVTGIHWINLTPGDVARALMLTVHCWHRNAAGADAIIREARELNRTEILSLAMAYTIVESDGITDEKATEMQQAAMEFRATELEAERLDDVPEDDEDDDYDDEEDRPR